MTEGDELLRMIINHKENPTKGTLKVSVVIDGVLWRGTVVDPADWVWKITSHWLPVELEEKAKAVTSASGGDIYLHLTNASTSLASEPIRYVRLPFREVTAWWFDHW
ncbi:hypothetical protein [Streptomyces lincolnensis]|uniref:hypothetical protein n=1 Tax=Streptomyces lincolnensis TaxID=1915 RepID=UPI0037D13E46